MKKLLFLFVASLFCASDMFAGVDRYKTDVDSDHTINHVTSELPLYYSKERTNMMGIYTLATNIGGKSSGTLSFDIKENELKFTTEVRNAILRIAKDIRNNENPKIEISFVMSNGEKFTFDGSYFNDWRNEEWNQLLHVTYNSETKEFRSYIMFPLEYLKSSNYDVSGRADARYKYVLKALSKRNIAYIQIMSHSNTTRVRVDIPLSRPTAETMNHMIHHKIKATKTKDKKSTEN